MSVLRALASRHGFHPSKRRLPFETRHRREIENILPRATIVVRAMEDWNGMRSSKRSPSEVRQMSTAHPFESDEAVVECTRFDGPSIDGSIVGVADPRPCSGS